MDRLPWADTDGLRHHADMHTIARPTPSEHAEYYGLYVSQVKGDDVLRHIADEIESMHRSLVAVGEEDAGHRYAQGKWSIKQVVGHLLDAERVFSYRALAFARGDAGELPSMDQNEWMAAADFDASRFTDLIEELRHLRLATLSLFKSFSPAACARTGVASGNTFTVRSLVWITAGHATHHMNILRQRYDVL